MTNDQIIATGFLVFISLLNVFWSWVNITYRNKLNRLAADFVEAAKQNAQAKLRLEILNQALDLAGQPKTGVTKDKAPDADGEEPYFKVWVTYERFDPVEDEGEEQDVYVPSVACFAEEEPAVDMVGELTEFGQMPKVWRQLVLRTIKGIMERQEVERV